VGLWLFGGDCRLLSRGCNCVDDPAKVIFRQGRNGFAGEAIVHYNFLLPGSLPACRRTCPHVREMEVRIMDRGNSASVRAQSSSSGRRGGSGGLRCPVRQATRSPSYEPIDPDLPLSDCIVSDGSGNHLHNDVCIGQS